MLQLSHNFNKIAVTTTTSTLLLLLAQIRATNHKLVKMADDSHNTHAIVIDFKKHSTCSHANYCCKNQENIHGEN